LPYGQLRGIVEKKEEESVYDPTKPLDLKFKVLQDYQEQFTKLKSEGKLEGYIKAMP
jgi:large subunit ribosomal protein L4